MIRSREKPTFFCHIVRRRRQGPRSIHAVAAASTPGRLNGFLSPEAKPDLNEALLALITADPRETFMVRTRMPEAPAPAHWAGAPEALGIAEWFQVGRRLTGELESLDVLRFREGGDNNSVMSAGS